MMMTIEDHSFNIIEEMVITIATEILAVTTTTMAIMTRTHHHRRL
jgi:hypothetical protein